MNMYLFDSEGVFLRVHKYIKGASIPTEFYTLKAPPTSNYDEICIFKEGSWAVQRIAAPPEIKELTNVSVTGEHVTLGAGGIWWLPINEGFTLTANAQLQDMEMMIIIERVVSNNVIDDLRAKASIVDGLITINSKFTQSGNYQITSERLNAGLEAVDAPFRLVFDNVEFDAYV
ncbi:hypothetical protein H5119_02130 [Pseudoalteromonas sp. SG45-5]|uniref:hypothetical protein n=1 Tax=unclassified Pseudoalteromonas TaxID=194690 RepID=UPI0015F9F78B|nr:MULTISPECIES: hypothetical protein [unclassified Pseudoalteromonas]MBB1384358.1 hypothetical protein [Pseudoalteromonas sp. SG45-5]MBB1392354.1 hypothetical protein [Pseudoalteromonas sp. SG44-4]MBB1446829.1 hypothetical protein [Pseudoalteromonas sp. SG41-6]